MRCLAVHGHRQDAEIFSQRIARLRGKLDKVGCELVFVNAPFRLPLDPGQKVPMRSWTDPAAGGADAPADWAPAHAFIDAAFAAHGQFDGVLGFSQVASLALFFFPRKCAQWEKRQAGVRAFLAFIPC